jgi:ubiquinone/menaquinone biosynthesis C-methylase UbiE
MHSGRKSRHPLQFVRQGPDRGAALSQYEARAATYDFELALFEPIRATAIERLRLQPGETVLDVGCGTGLSLERLRREVGATGHVVGIEQCPAMIARARDRLCAQANENVTLICAPAEESQLEGRADAALFHFTHDVLQRPAALDRVLRHLKPGGRLVACGLQWAPPWALPINFFVWGAALRSVSSFHGLERPWALLAERVDGLEVEDLLLGAVFLARGVRLAIGVGDVAKVTADDCSPQKFSARGAP